MLKTTYSASDDGGKQKVLSLYNRFTSNFKTTKMKHLIIYFFGLLLIISCGQVDNKTPITIKTDTIATQIITQTNDTDFAVIKSADNPKAIDLSADEIKEVNEIYIQCIADNKESLLPSTNYKRQYFPVINSKGEKEVRVNCFCGQADFDWKKEELMVCDGGNCFFNFVINLKTKKYYDLIINGEA